MASSAVQHWTASPAKEGCHWKAGGKNRQTWQLASPAWYPRPTIATTDIQEATVAGLATSWHQKSMEAYLEVGSGGQFLPSMWPHNPVTGFWPPSGTVVSAEPFLSRNRGTAVPAEGNGKLQSLIYVYVARPRRCSTLLNPVPWQYWMAAYLSYTLQMKTLFCGWPVMVHDTDMHTKRRRRRLDDQLHWLIWNTYISKFSRRSREVWYIEIWL